MVEGSEYLIAPLGWAREGAPGLPLLEFSSNCIRRMVMEINPTRKHLLIEWWREEEVAIHSA